MDSRIKLLIAVGASVTANCQPCLEHLISEVQDSGAAIAIAKMVRKDAMAKMDQFASTVLGNANEPSSRRCVS